MSSFIEASRIAWQDDSTPDASLTHEQLQTGCLQRIASATEAMAKNYNELLADRDRYKRWYADRVEGNKYLLRQNAALRGVITRMKRKQEGGAK